MPNKSQFIDLESDILIKDTDGSFKIFDHGQLKTADKEALFASPNAKVPAQIPAPPAAANFQSTKKNVDSGKASFDFHPDDQQEIQNELDRLNAIMAITANQKKYSVEKISRKLDEKHNLNLAPADFEKFVKILLSFFRQARSLVQTRSLLLSAKEKGGLNIAEDKVDKILSIARHLKDKIEGVDGVVVNASQISLEAPNSQPEAKSPVLDPFIAKQALTEEKAEMPAKTPVLQPTEPKKHEIPNKKVVRRVQEDVVKKTDASIMTEALPKVQRPPSSSTKLPELSSLKKGRSKTISHLLGKVDELAHMSLQEFRMLDDDPRMRVAKILQRIEQLGEESITRKAQGIDGWRNSEVYRVYLMMGQKSLEEAKDIKALVAELDPATALSIEEFEAITDLNKRLRF